MYFRTALWGVRLVGFSTSPLENNHQITPENDSATVTQIAVQMEASLVLMICAFRLKTPKSRARNKIMTAIKMIQTAIERILHECT